MTMTEELTTTVQERIEAVARKMGEVGDALQVIRVMAGRIADMMEQLQGLQQKVAMLEKLTPMQVKDVNLRIRERAVQLEAGYGLPEGSAEKLMTLIRRQVRMETGARSARDIARCDYPVVCEMISDWEDYQAISALR